MPRLSITLLLGALLLPLSCQSPEAQRAEANAARDTQLAQMARQNAEAIAELRAEVARLREQMQASPAVSAAEVLLLPEEMRRSLATEKTD